MAYSKNQLLDIEITDMTNEGEGVGKVDGFTFFVKDTLIGDVANVRVTKVKKNYGYARLEKLISPSSFRVEPECALARKCGGCQIQEMDYPSQLKFKENKVKNNLIRLGGFSEELINEVFEPIIGMTGEDGVFRYRNKAQYPIGYSKDGELIAGFYAGRTHSIISVDDCMLGVSENAPILKAVQEWMKDNKITAYDETLHTGVVRHVLIRKGFSSGEIMVCLVINADKLPCEEALIKALTSIGFEDSKIASVSYSVNEADTNVIMGDNFHTVCGSDTIEDKIGDLKFKISPLSFYQVNPVQTYKLYSTALEFAALDGGEVVWDLYCGIGTISLFLAQKAGHVYGVEVIPEAIEDAKENARLNGLDNTTFFVGKAEEVLPDFCAHTNSYPAKHPKVIVVDPPRKGCDSACLETMVNMAPERIVYVSCDSATLARDLKYLTDNGFALKRVRPCDMFPMSIHVETVVLLSRVEVDEDR